MASPPRTSSSCNSRCGARRKDRSATVTWSRRSLVASTAGERPWVVTELGRNAAPRGPTCRSIDAASRRARPRRRPERWQLLRPPRALRRAAPPRRVAHARLEDRRGRHHAERDGRVVPGSGSHLGRGARARRHALTPRGAGRARLSDGRRARGLQNLQPLRRPQQSPQPHRHLPLPRRARRRVGGDAFRRGRGGRPLPRLDRARRELPPLPVALRPGRRRTSTTTGTLCNGFRTSPSAPSTSTRPVRDGAVQQRRPTRDGRVNRPRRPRRLRLSAPLRRATPPEDSLTAQVGAGRPAARVRGDGGDMFEAQSPQAHPRHAAAAVDKHAQRPGLADCSCASAAASSTRRAPSTEAPLLVEQQRASTRAAHAGRGLRRRRFAWPRRRAAPRPGRGAGAESFEARARRSSARPPTRLCAA